MRKAFNTVLVVEDDPLIRRLAASFLEELEIDVMTASTVAEAADIALTKGDLIDAGLIDLDLPDGSGFELPCRMRRAMPKLPVIIATAYARAAVPHPLGPKFGYLQKR